MRLVSLCADVKLLDQLKLRPHGLREPLSNLHTPAHVLSVQIAQRAGCGKASSLGVVQKSAGFIHEVNHWLRV